MNRSQRREIANETLGIIDSGRYSSDSGNNVWIKEEIEHCISETRHYSPADFGIVEDECARQLQKQHFNTSISVVNSTTFAAARELTLQRSNDDEGLPDANVMSLNFASAKNPGGGFLGGSQAQEECLARASALYGSINPVQAYYQANRRCGTALYTEHMIYSPSVPVFRDDHDQLLDQPWCTSVITSPAVNRGALKHRSDISKVAATMQQRIANVLAVSVVNKCRSIVLGAWGCGVFRNEPAQMAAWFAEHLTGKGQFANAFENVVFAVWDKGDRRRFIGPFEKQFQ